MVGGSNGWLGRLASVAIAGVLAGGTAPARAADLGGDCCADLEERIAELEATTARKGNRKVSLEISGHINEALIYWDDGAEDNVYVVTNDNSRTRFRFKGKAKINADWEAGYLLEIGVRSANSKRFNQFNDEGSDFPGDVGFDIRDSVWYLKSKTLGTGWVGLTATATDAITEINLTQTSSFSKYSDVEDTGLGLLLRSAVNGELTNSGIGATGQTGLTWRRLIGDAGDQPGEGEKRYNGVKYETPTFGGFSASAFWGEDDFWDLALRYAGEFGGFKVAAGIGYGRQTDGPDTQTACNATLSGNQECDQFGGSASIVHEATGLFVNFGAGIKVDDLIDQTTRFANTGADDEQTFWSVQAGIEKKFIDLGKTTIYGEYYNYDGGGNSRRTVTGPLDAAGQDALYPAVFNLAGPNQGNNAAIWSTGVEVWGAGVAQGIDAAAMIVYLSYRHVEGDLVLRQLDDGGVATGAIADAPLEDLDLVLAGGIIRF